jgi:hypothetical protein
LRFLSFELGNPTCGAIAYSGSATSFSFCENLVQ